MIELVQPSMVYEIDIISMKEPLKSNVALVTGASKGIGRAICVELARAGYWIIVNYLSDAAGATETLAMVENTGSSGQTLRFDVADQKTAAEAIQQIIEQHGGVDVLVNNAGVNADGLFITMTREEWDGVIATSLNGFYNVTQPVLEHMVRRKKGSIVSIASLAGLVGNRGQANYAAAKAGLIAASRSVASEVARLGIRVNVVAPGLIDTEMIKNAPVANIKTLIPMGRIGRPEEVARAVRFLCSGDASYITGQVLSVNGGMF